MSPIQAHIAAIQSQLCDLYDAPEAEALSWWVVEEMTGLSRTQLQFGYKDTTIFWNTQEKRDFLEEVIVRLRRFEPIQYIFEHTLWGGLDLRVTPATLIPRPETAEMVTNLSLAFPTRGGKRRVSVLDIGTGSGCIAIALKKAHPEWDVMGIDVSEEALVVARENAERNGVDVRFVQGDVFSDEIERFVTFDIVVSNPPYVCEREKVGMRRNVLDYEPAGALFVPDDDPLCFYRRIAELHLGEYLFFEINEVYGSQVVEMLREIGYQDIHLEQDMYGKDRFVDCRLVV